jgi:threonine/homoserine/homoserine lactone efflux protein
LPLEYCPLWEPLVVTLFELTPFLISAFVLEITPGPNMGLLIVIAVTIGRKAGFATTAGVALGLLILGTLASLGMAKAIETVPALYEGLRMMGLAYLLYLAFDMYRQSAFIGNGAAAGTQAHDYLAIYFRRGLVSNLINPKAALFFLIALPSFIPERLETGGAGIAASLPLVAIYVAIATTIHLALVAFASRLQSHLARSKALKPFQALMGLALVGVAIWQFVGSAR